MTLEARIKRKRALGFIEELREFAHVIDVTQLYYTPDLYRIRHGSQPSNLAFDETYLLYSTQMLGVISNLAPSTRVERPATRSCAASEVQMLAMAIATKHLAKAEAAQDERGTPIVAPGTGRMTFREAPLVQFVGPRYQDPAGN